MMRTFHHAGLSLSYRDEGSGPALVFQHGLGANADQAAEVIGGYDGFRRITLECRGHGNSELGLISELSIATFCDDLLALLDHLNISRCHIGGISMGAAVTSRLVVLNPLRAQSLCVARPAWFDRKSPENMAIFAVVAAFLEAHGPDEGRAVFAKSSHYLALKALSPDNAASLLGQFERPDTLSTQALLSTIAVDGPGLSFADYRALRLPVQVIGHGQDAIHPLAMAQQLADAVEQAKLVEITPKSVSKAAYLSDLQSAYAAFLASVEQGESAHPWSTNND
jgi:pimeloyl-ACP methyl ester carboxylesterase